MLKVRCRGIIIDQNELLTVRHPGNVDFICLPGGKLEHGESPVECIEREIVEELGIIPVVGKLLYVNNYLDNDKVQSIEFFFEICNGSNYRDICLKNCSHVHELDEVIWIIATDNYTFMPTQLWNDFKHNSLPTETKFIS